LNVLPSKRFLLLLALLSTLFVVSALAAFVADAVLLALFVADAAWAPVAALRIERRAPQRMGLGAASRETLLLENRGKTAARVRLTDDLPEILVREGDWQREAVVPPGRDATVHFPLLAERRGDAEYGDVHVRVLGPLGLAWRQRRVERADPLRVLPGVMEVRRYRLLGLHNRLREAGFRPVRQRGEGGSFESLREYTRGDDPRTIDWKASARRSKLIVRQYEVERRQNVVMLVDAGRLMTEKVGDRERLDYALTAALLLADVAALHGDQVGLLVFADRVQQYIPPSRGSISTLAEALGGVHARMVEPNYPAAFTYLAKQLRRRSLLVVFTDVIDAQASSALVAHLGKAASRHLPIAVALRNPDLEATAQIPAASEADVYRRAAAEELLQARAAALTQMQRSGILIADSRPTDAVPNVVNRYLDVKRRGLL
jgi:uncharacterized protein (DUF58 family)